VSVRFYLLAAEQRPSRTAKQRNIRRSTISAGDLHVGIVHVVVHCSWADSNDKHLCTRTYKRYIVLMYYIALVSINLVALRRARLVVGWETVCGPVCNQPSRHRRNLWGDRYPTFWTGVPYHTFQDENMKNLLLSAVNRGDLQRLQHYNKTFFGRGSALEPAGGAHDTLPDPRVGWEGISFSCPFSSPSRLGTQGCLVLLLSWYPHFLD